MATSVIWTTISGLHTTQYFLEVFVGHELEGMGFWTSALPPVLTCCEISHQFCECVQATWNYIDELEGD